MISVENLKVEFSARPLFENVSFVINDKDRIALVGKNGAGKSTLLKILSGMQTATSGSVSIPNDSVVGYLPQVMKLQDDTTVREEAQKAFASVAAMENKVKALENQVASRTDYDTDEYMALVEKYTNAHDRLMMMGVENKEAEMERTLVGLGFSRSDFDRPTSEFSGGWRMRIELAKILLQDPDVLLLDEPTNHLDIESIQWLEQFLVQSAKAVVLVSHDRAFINNVTNRTIEISCRHIVDYKVKYDEYVVLRAERREQQMRAYENQQKEIADTKAFIERFRYQATKAVQVQQRIRQLEKIVPVEIDEVDTSALRLKFPPCLRSGDYPVICDGVGKTYSNRPQALDADAGEAFSGDTSAAMPAHDAGAGNVHVVFSDVSFIIKRGEKVAFVGKNGEGKSTLVKCIMNEIPYTGNLKIGHNVQIGYFAQNQAQLLDEELTVFQTIDNVAVGDIRLRINDILGAFMFGGEASEKKVKVLSGGERSRLAMIKLLLEPVNLLILDEPTNHLDMQSKDVLKEAIKAFDGTAIIVSHDREFLDGLVEKVYEFGGGAVKEHLGGIYDFLRHHNVESIDMIGSSRQGEMQKQKSASREEKQAEPATSKMAAGSMDHAERKEIQKKINRLQKSVRESESKIEKWEQRIGELDTILYEPQNAANMELINEYTNIKRLLEDEELRWTSLAEQLEEENKKL